MVHGKKIPSIDCSCLMVELGVNKAGTRKYHCMLSHNTLRHYPL